MKYLITFLFSFYIYQLSAQSKLGMGIVSSIDGTGINRQENYAVFGNIGYDDVGLGYQVGLRFRYQHHAKFSFQTGLSMFSHQLRTPTIYLKPRDVNDPFVPQSMALISTLKMIQVPLIASFYFGNKLKFGGSIGTSYNLVYRADHQLTSISNQQEKVQTSTNKINTQNQFVSIILAVGAEYSFKNIAIRAEPTGSYQVYFFNNDFANQNYNFYSVGLNLSGFYFF